MKKAAQRSADLTRQLLAFARKQTIALVFLNPKNTIEGMLKILKRLIGIAELIGGAPGGFVFIGVSDSGCAMDRQTMDKLFDPFLTTKKKGEGPVWGLQRYMEL